MNIGPVDQMNIGPVDGEWKSEWKPTKAENPYYKCRGCGFDDVWYRKWESWNRGRGDSDDVKYECRNCKLTWWVYGIRRDLMSVQDKLRAALETAETRGKVYGAAGEEGHRLTGAAIDQLFPKGLFLSGAEEFTRFLLLCMLMVKIGRYAKNFKQGGHADSVHDLGVYAFLLEDYDGSVNNGL